MITMMMIAMMMIAMMMIAMIMMIASTVSVWAEHCCSWWQACSCTVWQTWQEEDYRIRIGTWHLVMMMMTMTMMHHR